MNKKHLVFLLTLIFMLVFTTQATSAGLSEKQSFQSLWAELLGGSRAVQKSDISISQSQLSVYHARLARANALDMLELNRKWDIFSAYDEFQFILLRDLRLGQAKYQNETMHSSKQITLNALQTGLRDLYLGLYNAELALNIKIQKRQISATKLAEAKIKEKEGIISRLELADAEFAYLKAGKEVDIALRELAKLQRTISSMAGADLNKKYSTLPELNRTDKLKPVEYYIENALKNRFELADLKKQTDLKEQELSLYESGYYLNYEKVKRDYKYVVNDYQKQLSKEDTLKIDIETEIRKAYNDILTAENQIAQLQNSLDNVGEKLKTMVQQYRHGLITESLLLESEISFNELENQLRLLRFSYNTKRLKLDLASQIGPGY